MAEKARLKEGDLLVIGCSTSAVQGELIGTHSSVDVGAQLWQGVESAVKELKLDLAVQCCEHLNRALVTEKRVMERYGFERVNAIPQPKAGGSFATQ
ncbi:MAG: DUF436 family protein, partial [Lachnospiraceae bacterium]|nr:DUF436 family protein [Lachnospiraceae bacterium]